MRRYRVLIADRSFDVTVRADGDVFSVDVDGTTRKVSLEKIGRRRSHMLVDALSREVDLKKSNGLWDVFIDGRQLSVDVVDFHLAKLKKTSRVSHAATMSRELKAPMPGMTLKLAVVEGQAVKKGDTLIILEAMKMENLIKATGDGTVAKIHVAPGTSVEKGQTLIEFS